MILNPKSGKVIARGSGAGAGRGSSLRAEGFGMLAALKFIELAAKFTGRKDTVVIEGVSDNEELIQRG